MLAGHFSPCTLTLYFPVKMPSQNLYKIRQSADQFRHFFITFFHSILNPFHRSFIKTSRIIIEDILFKSFRMIFTSEIFFKQIIDINIHFLGNQITNIGTDDCNPKCVTGYSFSLDGESFQKCRYMAFMPTLNEENNAYIRQFLEKELEARALA